MPRIQTSINQATYDKLVLITEKNGYDSASKAAADIIKLGLKVEENYCNNTQQQGDPLQRKHGELLLTILAIVSDILRCINHPDKTKYHHTDPEDEIAMIRNQVQAYIDKISQNQ